MLERRPPVLPRPEDPGDEDVGEAALAQTGRDGLDQLATARVGALVLVGEKDAGRIGDDQAVGVPCHRFEALALDRFEVVEPVEQRAEADQRQRPWIRFDGHRAIRVPRCQEGVVPCSGRGLKC